MVSLLHSWVTLSGMRRVRRQSYASEVESNGLDLHYMLVAVRVAVLLGQQFTLIRVDAFAIAPA